LDASLEKMRVTSFNKGANQISKQREVTLMLDDNERIVRHKIGLLNFAAELTNVSKACKTMGLPQISFLALKLFR